MEKASIFVSIAAFCDPFLRFTIESLFKQASVPETLVLGVVDQSAEPIGPWLAAQPFADQVRYLHIDPLHSRGVCWARHLAQTLYDDEAYFLQVDSHTWFAARCDDALRAGDRKIAGGFHRAQRHRLSEPAHRLAQVRPGQGVAVMSELRPCLSPGPGC
ncbi:UDP-N-acetylglucosamine-transferase [Wenzhouxiangella limi]|nr:UDP-N-acetylglucosamine-transferase [Wenzhouxiangella limi]